MRTDTLDIPRVSRNAPAMATESGGPTRTPIIRVGPVSEEHWTVHVDDDPTPLSEHRTRADAESAARTHAEMFGYPEYVVHALNGDQQTVIVNDPEPRPPYPGEARGESAG
jgi:hypothetical protein